MCKLCCDLETVIERLNKNKCSGVAGGIIMCKYCEGENRKPLMKNNLGNYYVVINPFNYLEDSVIGNSVDYSLFGEKINYCPICGRKLKEEKLVN